MLVKNAQGLFVFVPAFNEEATLGKVLDDLIALKKKGLVQGILVVNDASTDKTREIAEKRLGLGVERVINHKKNMGKAFGFYEAALWAKRNNAGFLGMFDADLYGISEKNLNKMKSCLKNPKIDMVLGQVYCEIAREQFVKDGVKYSGQRIIRMKALKPLLIGQKTWLRLVAGIKKAGFDKSGKKSREKKPKGAFERRGYGLELALTYFIGKDILTGRSTHPLTKVNVLVAKTEFKTGPLSNMKSALRPNLRKELVVGEVAEMKFLLDERRAKLKKIRAKRQKNINHRLKIKRPR